LHFNAFERGREAISGNFALFARNCLTSTFKYIAMQTRKGNCEKGYSFAGMTLSRHIPNLFLELPSLLVNNMKERELETSLVGNLKVVLVLNLVLVVPSKGN